MRRPQDLAEVTRLVMAGDHEFAMALNEFLDEFYLDHGNRAKQQSRLDPEPPITGDAIVDSWIGAAGEHLAQRWGLQVPGWTEREAHFALKEPAFYPSTPAVRGILIVESPPAFRSRLIFTRVEPLDRARFPAGVARAQLALEWPKLDATARSDQGHDNSRQESEMSGQQKNSRDH